MRYQNPMSFVCSVIPLLISMRDKSDNKVSKCDESFRGKHVGQSRIEAGAKSTILRVQVRRPLKAIDDVTGEKIHEIANNR